MCGAEKRYPWLLWDADWGGLIQRHIEEIMHDKDGRPFDVCRRCYRLARAHLTKHALDGGESADLQAESTPEVLSTSEQLPATTQRK